MAKMIKDTQVQVHPVTGEEGTWAKAIKSWIDPQKKGDKSFKGMVYYVKGSSVIRDKSGNDITAIFS